MGIAVLLYKQVQTLGLGCINKNSLTSFQANLCVSDCLENRELKYSKLYFLFYSNNTFIFQQLYRTYCLIYKLHEIINKYGSNHNFINFIQNIIWTSSTTYIFIPQNVLSLNLKSYITSSYFTNIVSMDSIQSQKIILQFELGFESWIIFHSWRIADQCLAHFAFLWCMFFFQRYKYLIKKIFYNLFHTLFQSNPCEKCFIPISNLFLLINLGFFCNIWHKIQIIINWILIAKTTN